MNSNSLQNLKEHFDKLHGTILLGFFKCKFVRYQMFTFNVVFRQKEK